MVTAIPGDAPRAAAPMNTRGAPAAAPDRAQTTHGPKRAAVGGVDDVAHALRDASQRRSEAGDGVLAQLTGSAADGLERLSGALRHKDVNTLLRDADAFAREQPVAYFGLALAAGFLAVRFMKASRPSS